MSSRHRQRAHDVEAKPDYHPLYHRRQQQQRQQYQLESRSIQKLKEINNFKQKYQLGRRLTQKIKMFQILLMKLKTKILAREQVFTNNQIFQIK